VRSTVGGFLRENGNVIAALVTAISAVAATTWYSTKSIMDTRWNIDIEAKNRELAEMRIAKNLELEAQKREKEDMRVELDITRNLLRMGFTEEFKPYREVLEANKKQGGGKDKEGSSSQ